MQFTIVSIQDRAINAYVSVQLVRAEGEAIRMFIDAINNPESKNMHKHPDDFDLYVIGKFDDQTGEITAETPRKIGDGKQLYNQQGE